MNTMFEILVSLWDTVGAATLPDYIEKILYYISLLSVILIIISPIILLLIILSIIKGSIGQYNG